MLKKFFSSLVSSDKETTENYLPEKSQHTTSLSQEHSMNDKHVFEKNPSKIPVTDMISFSFRNLKIRLIKMQLWSTQKGLGKLDMFLQRSLKKLTSFCKNILATH